MTVMEMKQTVMSVDVNESLCSRQDLTSPHSHTSGTRERTGRVKTGWAEIKAVEQGKQKPPHKPSKTRNSFSPFQGWAGVQRLQESIPWNGDLGRHQPLLKHLPILLFPPVYPECEVTWSGTSLGSPGQGQERPWFWVSWAVTKTPLCYHPCALHKPKHSPREGKKMNPSSAQTQHNWELWRTPEVDGSRPWDQGGWDIPRLRCC